MDATCHTPPATQSESASSNLTPVEPYVQTLVLKYQHLEVLHPLLQNLFESQAKKELFTSVMRHDHKMLMTRSQRLEDHGVNAYEKAFCVLMENEDDRIGALEIYVEKILGVGEVEGCARDEEKEKEKEKEEWMVKGVAVRALLKPGKRAIPSHRRLSVTSRPVLSRCPTAPRVPHVPARNVTLPSTTTTTNTRHANTNAIPHPTQSQYAHPHPYPYHPPQPPRPPPIPPPASPSPKPDQHPPPTPAYPAHHQTRS